MNKVQKEKHENVSEAKQDFLKKQEIIRKQIKARWGEREAESYDPRENCFTFHAWKAKGYRIKKGEKALSYPVEGPAGRIFLFYYLQVEKDA